MTSWIPTLVAQPDNEQIVWCKRSPWFDTPVLKTYSASDAAFLWTDQIGNDVTIPEWQIFAWRPH